MYFYILYLFSTRLADHRNQFYAYIILINFELFKHKKIQFTSLTKSHLTKETDGTLPVRKPAFKSKLLDAFLESAPEVGMKSTIGCNAPDRLFQNTDRDFNGKWETRDFLLDNSQFWVRDENIDKRTAAHGVEFVKHSKGNVKCWPRKKWSVRIDDQCY